MYINSFFKNNKKVIYPQEHFLLSFMTVIHLHQQLRNNLTSKHW